MEISGAKQTDIQQVLQQMRALRAQAQAGAGIVQAPQADVASQPVNAARETTPSFPTMMRNAIDSVNHLQRTSSKTSTDFLAGRHNDLVKVMVDSQKSSVGFQGLLQARNRLVSAYQDIMNMPI